MKKLFLITITAAFVFFLSCKKSKTKKKIEGKWEVTAMFTDEIDFLLQKKKGKFFISNCDTIHFERQEMLKAEITFDENERYERKQNITIKYLDTLASRLQCTAVYADSLIETTEKGTWRFEGKETLELLADNNDYEGNKLVLITDNEMEWQTDLIVDQGFVVFNGVKTTKFIKR